MVQREKIIVPIRPRSGASIRAESTSSVPPCLEVPQVPSIFPEPPGLRRSLPGTSLSPLYLSRPLGLERAPKVAREGTWKAAGSAAAMQEQAQRVQGGMVNPGCSQPHVGMDRQTGKTLHPTYTVSEKDAPVFGAHRG